MCHCYFTAVRRSQISTISFSFQYLFVSSSLSSLLFLQFLMYHVTFENICYWKSKDYKFPLCCISEVLFLRLHMHLIFSIARILNAFLVCLAVVTEHQNRKSRWKLHRIDYWTSCWNTMAGDLDRRYTSPLVPACARLWCTWHFPNISWTSSWLYKLHVIAG